MLFIFMIPWFGRMKPLNPAARGIGTGTYNVSEVRYYKAHLSPRHLC
jgi:hypothetical protein